MAKVRVQDATKELSANAGALLDDFVRLRKQSQDMLNSLKKISDGIQKAEKEKVQKVAQEALNKQIEASAGFMTSYSSDQAPEVPAEPVKPVAAEPVKPVEPKPAQQNNARPAQDRPQGERRPQGENRGPYGRPVQDGDRRPQGDRGPRPQGENRGPYGRPVQQGDRPMGDRPMGQRPMGDRPQGPRPQGDRPMGGARPQGGMGGGAGRPAAGGGFGRRMNNELAPTVEKERVSNYDPNKKNYVRQNDPERNANKNNRRSQQNMSRGGYMDDDVVRGKRKKKGADKGKAKIETVKIEHAVMTAETITVKDLTERIGKPAGEIIKKLMLLGIMATINQELDFDTAEMVASEFGVTLELKLAETAEDVLEAENTEDAEEDLLPRSPVVTIK